MDSIDSSWSRKLEGTAKLKRKPQSELKESRFDVNIATYAGHHGGDSVLSVIFGKRKSCIFKIIYPTHMEN